MKTSDTLKALKKSLEECDGVYEYDEEDETTTIGLNERQVLSRVDEAIAAAEAKEAIHEAPVTRLECSGFTLMRDGRILGTYNTYAGPENRPVFHPYEWLLSEEASLYKATICECQVIYEVKKSG